MKNDGSRPLKLRRDGAYDLCMAMVAKAVSCGSVCTLSVYLLTLGYIKLVLAILGTRTIAAAQCRS